MYNSEAASISLMILVGNLHAVCR